MKSLRVLGFVLTLAIVASTFIACGGRPSGCQSDLECAATESCYLGECVTIKQGPPPPADAGNGNGNGNGKCNAQTCPDGCCQGNVCRGQADTLCGKGGVSCADCSSTGGVCLMANGTCAPKKPGGCTTAAECLPGQACQNGQCVKPAACGANNCPSGCCDANGVCQPTPSESACGMGGGLCTKCQAGFICNTNAGICEQQSQQCNAQNCADGCCDAVTGKCRRDASQRNQFCGLKGATCTDCGNGKQCNAAGTCEGTQKQCNATSCPNGCCAADGSCQAPSKATCGTGGGACTACTGNNTCQAGACKPPQSSCDASNCPNGCCDSAGICKPFANQNNGLCGKGGQQCAACNGSDVCSAGSCSPPAPSCTAATCPNGCCDASGQCQVNKASACGTGGGACNACPAGNTCQAGQCKAPGNGPYPPSPYGSSPGSTIENLTLTKCGGTPVKLQDLRSKYKAILLTVSSGSS